MAKQEKSVSEVTETVTKAAEETLEKAQGAMENYFGWLQKTVSASPWGNTDFSKKLIEYTTQNMSAAFEFVQRLSQAKNFEDVVKLQTEFMETQFGSFSEQAKNLSETYTKAMAGVTKGMPFHMST